MRINNIKIKLAGISILLLISVITFFIVLNNDSILNIEAASAFYPMAQEIVDSKDVRCDVKMKSTTEVYEDIINGKADAIIVTKPSDEQEEIIKNANIDLEFKKISKEPLVIYVNKSNNISNLNVEQIQKIYYNDNINWNEFTNYYGIINTYQLEKNNGSQTCFESIVKNNEIKNNHYEIKTMNKIIECVEKDIYGIGYAFNSYYSKMYKSKDTKTIRVDGKDLEDEDYPLLFDVYLIYRKDNRNEKLLNFISNY